MPFASGNAVFTVMVCPLNDNAPCPNTSAGFAPSKFSVIGREPRLSVPLVAPQIVADWPALLAEKLALPPRVKFVLAEKSKLPFAERLSAKELAMEPPPASANVLPLMMVGPV